MASKSDIEAGRAHVTLYIKNSQFIKGMGAIRAELSQLSDHAMRVGKALFGLGAAMSLPFAAGVKEAADFEHQMKMISTMLDNPDRFMGGFSAGIQSMAVEFGESTDTMAKALTELLGSAVDPNDALGVLRQTVIAAKGGMTDTATATSALINVLNAFHIPASRANEVTDMLFQTVRFGVVSFDQLAEHVGAVTASSYAAGISMDEMGASIATMTRNGLQADVAITALQNILSEFLKPSDEGKSVAAMLGVQMNTATLRAKGLAGVMQTLAKASPEQLAKIFPDVRGLRGILALRGDLQGFLGDVASMSNKGGAAATAFQKMTGGLWDSFNKTRQAVIALAVAVGNSLGPPLQKLGSYILPTIQLMTDWATRNQRIIRIVALSAVGFMAAGAALIAFAAAIKVALFAMGAFAILQSSAMLAVAFGSALMGLFSPLGAVLALATALGAALMTAGGGWKLLADGGRTATTNMKSYFGELKDTVDKTFGGIRDAISAGDMQAAWRIAVAGMKVVWVQGTFAIREAWAETKAYALSVWSDFSISAMQIFNGLSSSVERLWINTVGVLQDTFTEFESYFTTAWATIQGAMAVTVSYLKNFWSAASAAAKAATQEQRDAAQKMIEGAASSAGGAADAAELKKKAVDAARAAGGAAEGAIPEDVQKRLRAVEERRQKRLAELESREATMRADLEARRSGDALKLKDAREDELAKLQKEMADAKAELDAAVANAAAKKNASGPGGAKPGATLPDVVAPGASAMAKSTPASFSASTLAYAGGAAKDATREHLQTLKEQLKEQRELRKENARLEKAMLKMEGAIRAIGGLRP